MENKQLKHSKEARSDVKTSGRKFVFRHGHKDSSTPKVGSFSGAIEGNFSKIERFETSVNYTADKMVKTCKRNSQKYFDEKSFITVDKQGKNF